MQRRSLIVLALGGVIWRVLRSRLPLCPMAAVLGVPCPGCGLTRATIALLHGDLPQALHLHPLVLVLAPIFVWAISSATVGYVRGPERSARPKPAPWLASPVATALAFTLMAATLGVWGVRFLGYLGGPVPVETFASWAKPASLPAQGRLTR